MSEIPSKCQSAPLRWSIPHPKRTGETLIVMVADAYDQVARERDHYRSALEDIVDADTHEFPDAPIREARHGAA